MSNNVKTISMVTKEALRLLLNEIVFIRNINRKYEEYFAKTGAKIGDTVNIRLPARYTVTSGADITGNIQAIQDTSVPFTIDQLNNVAVNLPNGWELFDLNSFSDQFMKPAMAQLADYLDREAFKICYKGVYNSVGDTTAAINSSKYLLEAATQLSLSNAPTEGRTFLIDPIGEANVIDSMKGLYNSQAAISSQFEKGTIVGNVYGFKVKQTNNIATHTPGTASGETGIKVDGAGQTGSTLKIKGMVGGLNAGDTFTIAGVYSVNYMSGQSTGILQKFVALENVAAGGTSVKVSPELKAGVAGATVSDLPANDAAVTTTALSVDKYKVGLAYAHEAFTFASLDLPMLEGAKCSRVSDPASGFSLRVATLGDIMQSQNVTRIDVLWGVKPLRPELACRLHYKVGI